MGHHHPFGIEQHPQNPEFRVFPALQQLARRLVIGVPRYPSPGNQRGGSQGQQNQRKNQKAAQCFRVVVRTKQQQQPQGHTQNGQDCPQIAPEDDRTDAEADRTHQQRCQQLLRLHQARQQQHQAQQPIQQTKRHPAAAALIRNSLRHLGNAVDLIGQLPQFGMLPAGEDF